MSFIKRIFLFMLVNILVMTTISIVTNLFGLTGYMTQAGIDYGQLMVFCLIWGMSGAFISLVLSRKMAKWMMGVQLVDETEQNPRLRELVSTVYRLAEEAGLPAKPEVGFYNSAEVNAFATGPTKARALVAVSTGLLDRMNKEELEGVIGHEIAHVANGDMVTMTLLQGVINAFVMFLARVISYAITSGSRSDDEERPSYMMQSLVTMGLEIALSVLGSIVVAWFSRWREFRADAGGAKIAGYPKMIAALEALKSLHNYGPEVEPANQQAVAAFKISSRKGGWLSLFSTHPDLDKRILALQSNQFNLLK
jgi:heat shock protein HtpX